MAGNSLGTLSIDVLANIANMVSDLGKAQSENEKAARKFQQDWHESIDSVHESFKTLAEIAGVGLSIEWAKEIVTRAGEAAEQVENLSKTLGIAAEDLQTMSFGAALVGGNLDTISSASAKLERSMEMAAAGSKQQIEALRSLGVTASQIPDLIKHPAEAFEMLAKRVSEAGDGMGKTAAVMQLFGRGGATMIPFLDEFGGNMEKIKQKSLDLSITLNEIDQGVLTRMQRSLNESGLAAKGMGNEFALALAPAVKAVSDAFVEMAGSETVRNFFHNMREDVSQFMVVAGQVKDMVKGIGAEISALGPNTHGLFAGMGGDMLSVIEEFQDAFSRLAAGAKQMWLEIKLGAETIWDQIVNVVMDDIRGILESFGSMGDKFTAVYTKLGLESAAQRTTALSQSIHGLADSFKHVTPDLDGYSAAIEKNRSDLIASIASHKQWADEARQNADMLANVMVVYGKGSGALVDYNAKLEVAHDTTTKLLKDQAELDKFLDGLAGKLGGPYDKAWADYAAAIDQATKMAAQFAHDGMAVAETQQLIADATNLATLRLREKTDADTVIFNLLDGINTKYGEQNRLIGLTGEALAIETEYQKLRTEADKAMLSVMGPLTEAQQAEIDGLHGLAEAHVKYAEEVKQSNTLLKSWASMAASDFDQAFSAINKDLVEGGSVMKDLVNVAKSVVQQILLQFEKLAIINPMMKAIFGDAAGNMSTMGSLSGGGGGGSFSSGNGMFGDLLKSWFGGGGGAASDMGGAGVLMQGGAGATAFAGSQAGAYASSPLMDSLGITSGSGYGAGGSVASSGAGISTAGVVGGVLAGIGEYQAAGGGAGGIAGGVAYGVGTYFATAAVTAGLGAAAAGGLSAGMAAGMAAIPVVGWIALAAMAINMISGGKLFGTAGKPIGGNMTETIGADGANVSAEMTFKGQKAFFGGAKYSEHNIPIDAAAQKAADDFLGALVKGRDDFATQFGVEMGDIVGGTFHQTLDKKGKVTGTDSTVLGVNYKGDTEQQFMERLQADNYLAVLDKMGLGASEFVSGLQADADKLFAGVQDFASATQAANTNLGKGFTFMALGAGETLVSVMKFVEGMKQGGETLSAAYNRLATAQAQYDQFTAQFKPAPTYVDPFEASIAKLFDQMKAAQAQANALAIAAGADGAAIGDLVNIQKTYASQMAALTVQLEQSAQQLAFSLGLTNIGSLDQINAEITRLTTPTQSATISTQNFGNAMKQVSQKANDAINLLLGNLSPLNDQEKLQIALQGLRAGTVTQEQVLTIGRSLYASTEAYNQLFAQVQQYPNHGSGSGGGGRHGGGSSSTTVILSAEDQAKLTELQNEKAVIEAANKLGQFRTLAQQIDEIAQAKGESIDQVMKEMGLNLKELEKGLGLKDDEAFNAYMDNITAQMDSGNNNTASIVGAIKSLPQALGVVLAAVFGKGSNKVPGPGTSAADPDVPGAAVPGTTDPTTPNRVGGGGRTMSDHEFIKALGDQFRDAMSPITNGPTQFASRNLRAQTN